MIEAILFKDVPFARSQVRSMVVDSNSEHGLELLKKLDNQEK